MFQHDFATFRTSASSRGNREPRNDELVSDLRNVHGKLSRWKVHAVSFRVKTRFSDHPLFILAFCLLGMMWPLIHQKKSVLKIPSHRLNMRFRPLRLLYLALKRIEHHVRCVAHSSMGVIVALMSVSSAPYLSVGMSRFYALILGAFMGESSHTRSLVR